MNQPSSSPWRWLHSLEVHPPNELVNVARLPEKPLELDYRTQPYLPEEEDNTTRMAVLIACLLAVVLAFLLHVEPLGAQFFGDPMIVSVTSGFSLWVGIILLAVGRIKPKGMLTVFLAGVVLGFLLLLLYYASQQTAVLVLAGVLAAIAVAWLNDALLQHYLHWMNANPFLPAFTRRVRQNFYEHRGHARSAAEENFAERAPGGDGEPPSPELVALRQSEMKELRVSWAGAVLVLLPYLLLPLLSHRLLVSWLVLLVPPLLACAQAQPRSMATARFTPIYTARVVFKALVSFLNYERKPAPAPGVFHSPVGTWPWRVFIVALPVFLISATLLPLVHFFPLGYEIAPWAWPKGVADPSTVNERGMVWALSTAGTPDWYFVAILHLNHFWLFFSAFLGLAACLVLPVLAIGSVLVAGAGPTLARAYAAMEEVRELKSGEHRAPEQRPDIKAWDAYLLRLKESRNEKERQLLWLGATLWYDYPVVVDPELLWEHAYLRGDTGSGKTALGMTPMVMQLLRQNQAAIVIIDLKGDTALFHAVKSEAEARGRVFKWFTNELERSTFVFNPLSITRNEAISLNQVGETLLEALSLSHGEGYGRGYFSRRARQWLTGMFRKHPDTASFEQLYEYASKREGIRTPQDYQDVFELLSVLESLSYFPQLNMRPTQSGQPAAALQKDSALDAAIDLRQAIREKHVIYFWLPAAAEAASVREIAKLAVYTLLQEHLRHEREEGFAAKTVLMIDEFQRMASGGFRIILEQARSYGIVAVLANQTFQDLQTPDADIRHTVASNTRLKQTFSAPDVVQQDDLMKASGEEPLASDWWLLGLGRRRWRPTPRPMAEVAGVNRTLGLPRVTRNQVITVSDDPFASLLTISRGSGYTQWGGFSIPISIRDFTITKERYEELKRAKWPEEDENTIVVRRDIPTADQIQGFREVSATVQPGEETGLSIDELLQ
jgi:hypothetical protein